MSESDDIITDKEQPSAEIRTCAPRGITSVHDDALVLCEAVQTMSEREAVKTVEAALCGENAASADKNCLR